MSTPTSSIAVVLSLAASSVAADEVLAPRAVALDDDFVVLGAPGYCADTSRLDLAHDPSVVLFGSCNALKDNALTAAIDPALVTVTVARRRSIAPDMAALHDLLATAAGRAQLSRNGDADSVEILDLRIEDGMVLLRSVDTSPGAPPSTGAETWRALLGIDGRLVSVSLTPFADRPLAPEMALATLKAQCDRLRAANTD